MSLMVWLPLNKENDFNNRGLNPITIGGSPTYNADGKIGGCYKCYSGNSLAITHTIPETTEFSYCCWIKIPSSITNVNAWQTVFYFSGKYGDTIGAGVVNWASYNQMKWYDSTGWEQKLWLTMAYDTWIHLAVTHTDGKFSVYINGDCTGRTYTTTNSLKLIAGTFNIGSSLNSTNGQMSFNDFRIYNHCLSPKEVKEISKGLVLHYPLNALHGTTNLVTGLSGGGQVTISNNTAVVSGTNADTYFYLKTSAAMVSGKRYRVSCIGEGFASGVFYRFPIAGQNNTSIGLLQVQNGYCEMYFTANDTCASAGTSIILDDNGRQPGAGVIKNLELVELNTVYDCSGYRNDGAITGLLYTEEDSPRYDASCKFNGATDIYLKRPFGIDKPNCVTVAFWHKPSSSSSAYKTICSNSYPHSGFWMSVNCESVPLWWYGGGFYVRGTGVTLSNNVWYHIAITYQNNTYQWYLNGQPVTTTTAGTFKSPTFSEVISVGGNHTSNTAGSSTDYRQYGNVSDFRMYATALSSEDILELYNTSAFIDNQGDVDCYDFVEDGARELVGGTRGFIDRQGYNSPLSWEADGSCVMTSTHWMMSDPQWSGLIPISPSGHTYTYDITYSNTEGNLLYIGFEKFDANKQSGSNEECQYQVATTNGGNYVRVQGTLNLSTANGNPACYTRLRILNAWNGASTSKIAKIHHVSLQEVTTTRTTEIQKTGIIDSNEFIEGDSAEFRKTGITQAKQLIEI